MDISHELKECIERIFAFHKSETLIFLDCVLEDSVDHPEYSANTVINNLSDIVMFERLYYGKAYTGIEAFLKEAGYSDADIQLLFKKQITAITNIQQQTKDN